MVLFWIPKWKWVGKNCHLLRSESWFIQCFQNLEHPVTFHFWMDYYVELAILSVKCKAIPQFWLTTIHKVLLHDFLQIVIVRLDDVKTQTNFLTSRFLLRTEYEPRFIVIKEVISKGRSFLQCYFVLLPWNINLKDFQDKTD